MLAASWTEHTVVDAGGVVYITPEPEPHHAGIRFFTRKGGVSKPPYDSLNVSTAVGDDERAVAENRSRLATALENRPQAWVRQVAGDRVTGVKEPGFAGEADALITGKKGQVLTIAIADCAPVALVGSRTVGMVHSGWRGTLAGISGKAAAAMDGKARAFIGPCIRRCCYEVSEELADQFARRFGADVVSGRYLSVPDAINKNLQEAGVEHVYDTGLCTGCRTDLFFSHRKHGPMTGRMLAAVMLK